MGDRRFLNVLTSAVAMGVTGLLLGEFFPLYHRFSSEAPFDRCRDGLGLTHALGGIALGIVIGILGNRFQRKPAPTAPPTALQLL